MYQVQQGEPVRFLFKEVEFEVFVINPHALGRKAPSLGVCLATVEKHSGFGRVAMRWSVDGLTEQDRVLILPSGNKFKIVQISKFWIVGISDWVAIASDLVQQPGRIRISTRKKLQKFLKWFNVLDFYAAAYRNLKGSYTFVDSKALTTRLQKLKRLA